MKGANRGFHFNPQDGSVTVQEGTQADITPLEGTFTPATALAQTATTSYEAILVPQTFAAGELKVTFRVGVNDYEWSNAAALTLSAGQNYAQAVAVTRAPMPAHAFVDMGEGLLWATCNVGAENPWDYGDYFAWGETTPKDIYSWGTYTFNPSGDGSTFTKYLYGDMLVADDDAATANWDSWRMPTAAEWSSLLDDNKYTWVWTTDYDGSGIDGMLVTSKIAGYIGNCIFLPAAGCLENASAWNVGTDGFYMSSSLTGFISSRALVMSFSALSIDVLDDDRYYGQSVRPVFDK